MRCGRAVHAEGTELKRDARNTAWITVNVTPLGLQKCGQIIRTRRWELKMLSLISNYMLNGVALRIPLGQTVVFLVLPLFSSRYPLPNLFIFLLLSNAQRSPPLASSVSVARAVSSDTAAPYLTNAG